MGNEKLLIHVGSTSEHKIAAVRAACEELCLQAEIVGVAVPSGVNEQPYGLIETRCGAYGRAYLARRANGSADIYVGIESGVFPLYDEGWRGGTYPGEHVDAAIVTVVDRGTYADHAISSGSSVVSADVEEARRRGFDKHTVSSVTHERTGCSATDSTPHYTGGRVHRKECLQQAVKIALSQCLTWRERKAGDE